MAVAWPHTAEWELSRFAANPLTVSAIASRRAAGN